MVMALDLRHRRLRVRLPASRFQVTTLGKLFTHTHTCLCHQALCNSVPVRARWCPAAGKVTVGLASHWPCVTDFSGLSTCGLQPKEGRWAPRLHSSWGTAHFIFLPAQRYAIAGTSYGLVSLSVSVCHKLAFYRNGWTDRAGFWHVTWLVGFVRPILHRVIRKFSYLQNKGTFLWNFVPTPDFDNFASAYRSSKRVHNLARERRGRSERDKLTMPPSSDARLLVYRGWSSSSVYSTIQSRGSISDSWYLLS